MSADPGERNGRYALRIEHPVADFVAWKTAFDSDPVRRKAGGVRRYRILRPVDDPGYVLVDLEFDNPTEAESFRAGLYQLWRNVQGKLIGTPQARIVELVESKAP